MSIFKKVFISILFLLLLLFLVVTFQLFKNSVNYQITALLEDNTRVASLNIHYIRGGSSEGPWSEAGWDIRKDAVQQMFVEIHADIFAFQEMETFGRQVDQNTNLARDWLLENNPDYVAGASGDTEVFPSTQPIFYKTKKFELVDQGWFFFSETPNVIYSRTFNGSYPAFASWVILRERISGEQMRVVNIHTDFESYENRVKSIKLVADKLSEWDSNNMQTLVVGDLNARHGSALHSLLEDVGIEFANVRGSTFHFNKGIHLFGAIDHIGYTKDFSVSKQAVVLQKKYDGHFPSDHYPVVLDLSLERE